MKRKLLICITALFALLITSCGNGLSVKDDTPQNMAKIEIHVGVNNSARHFFPTGDEVDVTKFDNFSLEVENTSTNEKRLLLKQGSYSDLENLRPIEAGTYNITLSAYKTFGKELIQFTDTLSNVQLVADKTNKLSFTLKPANQNLTGSISYSVTFDNSNGDVDVILPALCSIDEDSGQMELVKEPDEEDCFFKGTHFYNTSKETITGTLTDLEPGVYYLMTGFSYECGDAWITLDDYYFYNINVYGGFDTAVSQTVKLNPVYTIQYEDEDGTVLDAEASCLPTKYTRKTDFDLEAVDKDGYEFLGWVDKEKPNGGYIDTFATGNRGNKTFVAKYQELSIPVRFHFEKAGTDDDELEWETSTFDYYKSDSTAFINEFNAIDDELFVISPDSGLLDDYPNGITGEQLAAIIAQQESYDIYFDRIYDITYVDYAGEGVTATGDYVRKYNRNTPGFNLPELTKTDYEFVGWYSVFDLQGSGATAVPKADANKITFIASGTRGDLGLQAIWVHSTNSGIDIELVNDDDGFELSNTYEIKCTAMDTSQGQFKLSINPLASIVDNGERIAAVNALGEYTYQWIVDGDVIADETGSEFILTTNTFTPDSIHYIVVGATKDGKTYTLSYRIHLAGQE